MGKFCRNFAVITPSFDDFMLSAFRQLLQIMDDWNGLIVELLP